MRTRETELSLMRNLQKLDDTYLVGKIKAKAHPFVEYFKFLKAI